ncbi:MAG TPA: glycosyltransferase, partial [Verrucomicrobiae bacterium]
VVTIDEELAAFRWYDEVKSVAGGFKEWIAMYEMTRRYCKDPITPGLILEFFKKLQDAKVQAAAGFQDFGKFANAYYWKFYNELQTLMQTADCIPLVNKGIPFAPDKTRRAGQQMCQKPASPAPAGSAASPVRKVDVVLPAGHSWFVREGYVEALKASGNLGRVFYVPSWQKDELQTRELFEYLQHPESDAIFLMDTLWHAQQVHATEEWRQRWTQCPAKKIMFAFECMNNPVIRANPKWWQDNIKAVEKAAACVDAVIYAHEIDGDLFRQYGLAALWQPFAVDPSIFPPLKKFEDRQARGFFKGKAERFYNDDNCYRERRELIAYLRQHAPNVVVEDQYSSSGGGVLERNQQFIREMGEYQIVVGLPSLSPTMVVRPFEAMLSGCVFFQNRIAGEESNELFKDGEHLIQYDASKPEELVRKINEVAADPARGRCIAENGRQEVMAKHTIRHRVAAALAWLEQVPALAGARRLPNGGDAQSERKKIVIDGVIFDLQRGRQHGISRVWHRLLEQLAQTPLAADIVLFDRDGTAPAIPGIRKRMVAAYDYQRFEADSLWLQRWCDEENAALFISTYFTWAETTPTVIMLHDMIPELTGQNLQHPEWRAKVKAMGKAMGYFAVSQSTVNDFQRLYPDLARRKLVLTPNAVGNEFKAADPDAVRAFRQKYHLRKPYFLLVGNRALYKNASLFFKAFAQLPNRNQFEIVCTGGADKLEKEFEPWVADATCQVLRLSNAELCAAYSGATALVYPSLYEGFGLPILEAQKCGCPVITGRNSSLPEVAGEAAVFLNDSSEATMVQALAEVQRADLRQQLIAAGALNAQRFSWEKTGRVLAGAIEEFRAQAPHAPLRARDPINTIRRLIFMADELGAIGKNLGRNLRTISWQCEAFEYYDREEMGSAEAAVAVYLNQLGAPFIKQFAPVAELDNLTALALGLAAEARNDFAQAWACYAQAIAHVGRGIYGFRVALRLARVAARGGDAAASEKVRQQLVTPLRHSLPPKLDAAAEEAALHAWEPALPNLEKRSNNHSSPAHKDSVPLVSAIVSTFKSERFLRGCLEDLEAQTIAERLEIIVIDSHSPQNERAIVEEFQKKYANIVYIRTQERETVYGAWNRGARAARGKYLTNANTDDRHRPDALEILARTLDENPDVSLAYADCLVTYHENESYYSANPLSCYHWLDFSPRNLWVEGCFCGPQPMWRREVHEEHGYFDAQMVSAGDYEFWLRLAQNRKFLHVEKTLGLYLKSPTSVEHANREIGAKEVQISRDRYRECIMQGKPPFRPPLPNPTVAVEVMIPANHGSVTKAMAPKPTPVVAGLGRLDEARALFGRKDYAGAWAETATAIAKRPFHPEALLLLAEIAAAAGAGKVAKLCAQQARQFAPDWAAPRQFLAKPLKGDAVPEWLDPSRITHHASRLSVCLIVKNEEKFLAQCLKSVRDLADQIVVVDTGSTDHTVEIAREFGAELHAFAWCDDFAAARNAALEHATGDWVLMLDADEELPAAQHARLRADMSSATTMAFRLPLVNAGQENEGRSFVPRLFRNLPGVFFTGRIHEQIFASLIERSKNWGLKTALGTAELLHHGYAREMVRDRNKVERNLKLLRAAIEEAPADVNLVMNLGLELVRSGDVAAGVERYREAFALMSAQPPAAVVPELREVLLTQFTSQLYKVRAHDEVVRVLNSPLAQRGGLTASLHFALGLAYFELKQFSEAAHQMRQCLKLRHQACLTPINTDINTAAPQHCLALSLAKLGDVAGAEKAFLAALAETGHSETAKLDYAKFLRAQERPVDALHQLHEIVSANPRHLAAWQLGGEITLARAEFLEVALEWTAEAFQALPENPIMAAQRAEALMLNRDFATAVELWERLWRSEPGAQTLAALILCRVASDQTALVPVTDEPATSLAFVAWYQKVLAVRAQSVAEAINGRLGSLAPVLPTAARMLETALAEAGAIVDS